MNNMDNIFDFIDDVIDVVSYKEYVKNIKPKNVIRFINYPSPKVIKRIKNVKIIKNVPPEYKGTPKERKKKEEKFISKTTNLLVIPKLEDKKIEEKDKIKFFVELYGKETDINRMNYPLTKMNILGKEYIFAYANIEKDATGEII
ncbi:MAG: type II/IV secretion system ATPase subunit, partial [Nanopusillaceae archaeon]